ncbi:T-complex protein 11-like X-linked protein 1 [Rhodnius prolixus]
MENKETDYIAKEQLETNQNTKAKGNSSNKDINTLLHHLYIAHELAINEDININVDKTKHPNMEDSMRSSLKDSYWNLFKEQITENPPKLELAFELLTEIKKSLDFVMTPNIINLRNDVNEVLDIKTLKKQAENNAIDVTYYAKYIISVISKICAPVRDSYVAKLSKESDMVTIFRGIVQILSLMKYDLLNFTIKITKPYIMANNLAYEREKFKEYVIAIGGELAKTRKWLLKHNDSNLSAKTIVCNAFIDFLTWDNNEPYPETLFLEAERLVKLQLDYFRLTISCTLYFLAIGLLTPVFQSDDQFRDTIKSFILTIMSEARNDEDVKEITKNIAEELLSTIVTNLQKQKKTLKRKEKVELKLYQETMERVSLPNNKIRLLVCDRVNNYLKQSLSLRASSDSNFPQALNIFKKELNSIKLLFERIFKHNLLVCMEHYEHILKVNKVNDSLKQ